MTFLEWVFVGGVVVATLCTGYIMIRIYEDTFGT